MSDTSSHESPSYAVRRAVFITTGLLYVAIRLIAPIPWGWPDYPMFAVVCGVFLFAKIPVPEFMQEDKTLGPTLFASAMKSNAWALPILAILALGLDLRGIGGNDSATIVPAARASQAETTEGQPSAAADQSPIQAVMSYCPDELGVETGIMVSTPSPDSTRAPDTSSQLRRCAENIRDDDQAKAYVLMVIVAGDEEEPDSDNRNSVECNEIVDVDREILSLNVSSAVKGVSAASLAKCTGQ